MRSHLPSTVHQDMEIFLAHVVQDFMQFMKNHDLTMPQILALMFVYHAGKCQVSNIGTFADVSNAAASQMVERLVRQGLVERNEDPADRRIKMLRLSEKGARLIHQSVSSSHFLAELTASMNAGQQETIHAAMSIIAQAAQAIPASQERE